MAAELLYIRAELLHVHANQMMDNFARGELFVLNYLAEHGGTAYPKDLSKEMGVSSARIAAILNQMGKKNWISRITDTIDLRQTIITLTDNGRQEIESRKEEIIDAVIQMIKNIGPDDAKELLRIERKIIKTMKP